MRTALFVVAALLASGPAAAALPDPAPYDAVLDARARGGGFDYRGTTGHDRKRLAAYLANVGEALPGELSGDEKKAFYINAYNALAIETLLENPGRKITDVPGAFDRGKHRVGREMLTLDEIENRLRSIGDARIHFGIVCASRSCPPLSPHAFRADTVSETLDRLGREFVNDPKKNWIDRKSGRIALSKIFYWNRKEFERSEGTLLKFVSKYVQDPAIASWILAQPREPEFLEYDWERNQP